MAAKKEGLKMKTYKPYQLYKPPYDKTGILLNVAISQNGTLLHTFIGRIQSYGGIDIRDRKSWLNVVRSKETYKIHVYCYDKGYLIFDGTLE